MTTLLLLAMAAALVQLMPFFLDARQFLQHSLHVQTCGDGLAPSLFQNFFERQWDNQGIETGLKGFVANLLLKHTPILGAFTGCLLRQHFAHH